MHVMFAIATQCLCCCYATQCLCCCYLVLSLTCGRRHFVLVMATQCLCCCYVVLSLTCGRRHIEFNVATQCLCCCYVRVLSLTCGPLKTLPPSFFSRLSLMVILVMFVNGMIGSFGFRKLVSSLSLTKSLS